MEGSARERRFSFDDSHLSEAPIKTLSKAPATLASKRRSSLIRVGTLTSQRRGGVNTLMQAGGQTAQLSVPANQEDFESPANLAKRSMLSPRKATFAAGTSRSALAAAATHRSFNEIDAPLRPYGKKGARFRDYQEDGAAKAAFKALKESLYETAVLSTIDYVAARDPAAGRGLLLFVDACDYGWGCTLAQRAPPLPDGSLGAPRPSAV